jgi:hypothetical protein
MGGLLWSMNLGDHCQLPPVCDRACFELPKPGIQTSVVSTLGSQVYAQHRSTVFLLDTNVRQQVGGAFVDSLKHLRSGILGTDADILQRDSVFWLSRRRIYLSPQEQQEFSMSNDRTVEATCYNKERDEINNAYVKKFPRNRAIRARNRGMHATQLNHKKAGMIKNLPNWGIYSPGMMVKITCNLCVKLGLTNNTRGTLRDVLYLDRDTGRYGGYVAGAPLEDIILMVEIPNYTGPPLNDLMETYGQKSWIPISPVKLACDAGCHCTREMFPIGVAKADSVYCLQGLTAGDGKPIERVVLHWSSKAEAKWPNIMYVGGSRAEKETNFALADDIAVDDLKKIGCYPAVIKQQNEMNDLKFIALRFRNSIDYTQNTFASHIEWIIDRVREQENSLDHHDEKTQTILACMNQWEQSLEAWRRNL